MFVSLHTLCLCASVCVFVCWAIHVCGVVSLCVCVCVCVCVCLCVCVRVCVCVTYPHRCAFQCPPCIFASLPLALKGDCCAILCSILCRNNEPGPFMEEAVMVRGCPTHGLCALSSHTCPCPSGTIGQRWLRHQSETSLIRKYPSFVPFVFTCNGSVPSSLGKLWGIGLQNGDLCTEPGVDGRLSCARCIVLWDRLCCVGGEEGVEVYGLLVCYLR